MGPSTMLVEFCKCSRVLAEPCKEPLISFPMQFFFFFSERRLLLTRSQDFVMFSLGKLNYQFTNSVDPLSDRICANDIRRNSHILNVETSKFIKIRMSFLFKNLNLSIAVINKYEWMNKMRVFDTHLFRVNRLEEIV